MIQKLLPCLVLLALGCSGQQASVSGVVTLDGKPLDRGAVSFHAVEGGPTAVGPIDQSGRYQLRTGEDHGLPAGEYLVTVVANEDSVLPDNFASPLPGKLITPIQYGSTATTNLKETVAPGSNNIDLTLVSE